MGKKNKDMDEKQMIIEEKSEGKELSNVKDTTKVAEKIKGVFITVLNILLMSAATVCVVLLQRKIPDFELNSFRTGTSLLIVSTGLLITRQLPGIPKSEIVGVFLFSILSLASPLAFYSAVTLVPISYCKSVYFTSSVTAGILLYSKFLGEKVNLKSILFAILCGVGVVLSIQPAFIFTWKKKLYSTVQNETMFYNGTISNGNVSHLMNEKSESLTPSTLQTLLGCAIAMAAGIMEDFIVIVIKKKPILQTSVLRVLFWVLLFGVFCSLVLTAAFEKTVWPENLQDVFLITGHSVSFIFGWGLTMVATKYISGSTFSIICTTMVVIMLIPQYTLLKHILPGNRNWIEVLGGVLVFVGATGGSILDIVKGK